jgi:hypothetical protein
MEIPTWTNSARNRPWIRQPENRLTSVFLPQRFDCAKIALDVFSRPAFLLQG